MARKAIISENMSMKHVEVTTKAILSSMKYVTFDNIQPLLVRMHFSFIESEEFNMAYSVINEGFNKGYVAGYKYLECMARLNRRGEFQEIAQRDPLINLHNTMHR